MLVNEINQGKIVDIEVKMAQDRALMSSKLYKLNECDTDSSMTIIEHFIIPDSLRVYTYLLLDSPLNQLEHH